MKAGAIAVANRKQSETKHAHSVCNFGVEYRFVTHGGDLLVAREGAADGVRNAGITTPVGCEVQAGPGITCAA